MSPNVYQRHGRATGSGAPLVQLENELDNRSDRASAKNRYVLTGSSLEHTLPMTDKKHWCVFSPDNIPDKEHWINLIWGDFATSRTGRPSYRLFRFLTSILRPHQRQGITARLAKRNTFVASIYGRAFEWHRAPSEQYCPRRWLPYTPCHGTLFAATRILSQYGPMDAFPSKITCDTFFMAKNTGHPSTLRSTPGTKRDRTRSIAEF